MIFCPAPPASKLFLAAAVVVAHCGSPVHLQPPSQQPLVRGGLGGLWLGNLTLVSLLTGQELGALKLTSPERQIESALAAKSIHLTPKQRCSLEADTTIPIVSLGRRARIRAEEAGAEAH